MTPQEYKQQEIEIFLDAIQKSNYEIEDSQSVSTEIYVRTHKLTSYEKCKRKLELLQLMGLNMQNKNVNC